MRLLVLFALATATFALPGSGATSGPQTGGAEPPTQYSGTGVGLLDRLRHTDNQASPADRIVADSKDVFKGRFTYSFRIDGSGNVQGTGNGDYQTATWHLEGVNGSHGPFSCDVPMTTKPFRVVVTGRATGTTARIRFELVGGAEKNEEQLCGANFYGFASDDFRLGNSLELVQPPDGIVVSRTEPRIAPRRKLERLGDERDSRVNLHEWEFRVRAAPGSTGGDSGNQGSSGGAGPAARASGSCTINGTPGNDTLTGTPGRDVICGKAGNDVLRGLDGHDSLRGGAGDDRLISGKGNDALEGGAGADTLLGQGGRDLLIGRDGVRDTLDGGPQRDRAVHDVVDRVRNVEVGG